MKKTKKLKKILEESKPVPATGDYLKIPEMILKTESYRSLDVTKWMNDFCKDKGMRIMSVSVVNDGKAFTAFISYWSEE